jgi:hypothetical protein
MRLPVKIIRYLLIVIITASVLFLLLELVSRFYLFGIESLNYFKINSVHNIGVSGLLKPSRHPEIVYELKPGLDTYFKLAAFKTNSQGLRDKEYSVKKPPRTFRAAVLGASYVMSEGVDIDDVFHTVLEDRLNKESPDISYEFISFGVGGYDLRQSMAVLKHRALEYEPDTVLFCLGTAVQGFYADGYFRQIYTPKPRTRPFFESFFKKLLARNKIIRCLRHEANMIDEVRNRQIQNLKKIENVFSELGHIKQSRGISICIVILQHYIEYEKECNELAELAAKYGLDVIDTMQAFRNTDFSELIIYRIDPHPNTKANKIFAGVIYNYFKNFRSGLKNNV